MSIDPEGIDAEVSEVPQPPVPARGEAADLRDWGAADRQPTTPLTSPSG